MNDRTIGGTGAAALVCHALGVDYFGRSPWDVYLRYTGQEKPRAPLGPMRWGLDLEGGILAWYSREQRPGWTVERSPVMRDGRHHGSLDALLGRDPRQVVVVDAKRAVMRHEYWGTVEEPKTPLGYQVQLAHYGLIAEAKGLEVVACDLAIYDPFADANGREAGHVRSLPWADLRPLAIEWRAIVDAEVDAWERGELPPLDGSDAATHWLAVHCSPPKVKDPEAGARFADHDQAALIAEWRKATAEARAADLRRKALGQALIRTLEGRRLDVEGGGYVQPQTVGGGARLDSRRLKKERPDLYAEYSKPSTPSVTVRAYKFPKEQP